MQTRPFAQYQAAEALERHLGDPFAGAGVFSFKNAVALDELDEYPEEACKLLDSWNVFDYYIPSEVGGKLSSFEEFVAVLRAIARRDLTVAIAHGKTYLGAVAAWVGGSNEQKRWLASIIKSGSQVALGLTEKSHGSDLLASEVTAEKVAGGFLLSGEKWLVNNATRGDALTVFAKTGKPGDPRGFSLFLVEKNNDQQRSHTPLPKIKTHGIRGADISGIRFNDTFVPDHLVIGQTGAGLEIMLKAFQLTRTVIPALSLGAADTALRVAMDFAQARKLYGDSVFAIPHARRLLCDAFADLLICECLTLASVRSLHVEPQQMSLRSAIAKYYVPVTVERLIKNLSVVIGARQYLRQEHCSGIFQKIARDNAILSLFDGSTVVNLSLIALQLGQLASNSRKVDARRQDLPIRLARIFSLAEDLPDFNPAALTLHNHGQDSILQGLEIALEHLSALDIESEAEREVCRQIEGLTRTILAEAERQGEFVLSALESNDLAFKKSPEMFEQAERYCVLHAAACCLHMWLYNRERLGEFFRSGEWVVWCLGRLLGKLGINARGEMREHEAGLAAELERLFIEQKLFSIVPLQLAQSHAGVTEFQL
ncbi:MAG TPA: acyl-CoA dehydrogenase [Pyrinomonadaceae bacterium]